MTLNPVHHYHSRVYMPDTDASGIVYHANYLRFCDQARTEWLREVGFSHYLGHQQFIFVVTEAQLKYHRSLHIDQPFRVESRCLKFGGARFTLEQSIWRNDEKICVALITLATLSGKHQPIRLPAPLADALEKLVVKD